MNMNRIGKSSDFISECGNFKICASNEHDGTYLPLMRQGDMDDKPVVFASVTEDFVSFEDAMTALSNY
jgi:hypothetical protein